MFQLWNYAAKNKAQDQNAGGDGDKNKKRDRERKEKDADPVASQQKKWTAAGIQLVDNILKVNCRDCGLNSTHSSYFHAAWAINKSKFCLPNSCSFILEKARLASATHTPAATSDPAPEPSLNTLTLFCAELEGKIVDTEQHSTDPNAGTMAQMIRSMF